MSKVFICAGLCVLFLLPASPAAGQTRFATLYTFTGTNPQGLTAAGRVLYGAAYVPGFTSTDCGTIFELEPPPMGTGGAWIETTLYTLNYNGSGGCYPNAPFVGADGALYGLTEFGGAYGYGVLYELQPPASPGGAWTESVLYSFDLNAGGTYYPSASLVPGPNGSFYAGTAGGAYGGGALVQLQPPPAPGGAWTQTVLYNFTAGGPVTLIAGPNGVLYGANWDLVGADGIGQVFQLTPLAAPGGAWSETVLYNLNRADGHGPTSLTLASNGVLYGTTVGTSYSIGSGRGTIFELAPPASAGGNWTFTVLQDFGWHHRPYSPLILRDGNLYGAVGSFVTAQHNGEVFELQPPSILGGAWTLTHLHQFTGYQVPGGTMVMDQGGTIYGVTAAADFQPAAGTVYRITPK